jgi:hypothetical protein
MKTPSNLIDYLIQNREDTTAKHIDLIKYHIGKSIYFFGNHFKYPIEGKRKSKFLLKDYAEYLAIKIFHKKNKNKKKKILSSAYSNWNQHLEALGFDVYRPTWNLRRDFKIEANLELYLLTKKIKYCFNNKNFNYLIGAEFRELTNKFYRVFKINCITNNYAALFVPQDVDFFDKIAIEIFKELGKPSFFLHHGGIPNIYDGVMDNRTDYSIQWGQKQVDAYVQMGFDRSKFLISGHPSYNKSPASLRFELDQILVLTKSLSGVWPLEQPHLENRGNAIMYLYSIQKILQKLGVKGATLKVHPSENYDWYRKFIDNSFYREDKFDISQSLNNATLVIGPTSTAIIDSLFHCVNYVIYEPLINDKNILGWPATPPLDGSDPRIPIARSEIDLELILVEKKKVGIDVYKEFVKTPMDISFLTELI